MIVAAVLTSTSSGNRTATRRTGCVRTQLSEPVSGHRPVCVRAQLVPGSHRIDRQARHQGLSESLRRGATRAEIRQEPHDRYLAQMRERTARTPLVTPACHGSNTYYLNHHGDAAAFRPTTSIDMRWWNKHFPLSDYSFSRGPAV